MTRTSLRLWCYFYYMLYSPRCVSCSHKQTISLHLGIGDRITVQYLTFMPLTFWAVHKNKNHSPSVIIYVVYLWQVQQGHGSSPSWVGSRVHCGRVARFSIYQHSAESECAACVGFYLIHCWISRWTKELHDKQQLLAAAKMEKSIGRWRTDELCINIIGKRLLF